MSWKNDGGPDERELVRGRRPRGTERVHGRGNDVYEVEREDSEHQRGRDS